MPPQPHQPLTAGNTEPHGLCPDRHWSCPGLLLAFEVSSIPLRLAGLVPAVPKVPIAASTGRAQPLPRAPAQPQPVTSTFLDSCPFPPLVSLCLNLGQEQLLSLVCAQEGTDHTGSGAMGRGSSSPATDRDAGTTLCPWEFTPVSQNISREAQGDMAFTPTRVALKGWMQGPFKELAGGK